MRLRSFISLALVASAGAFGCSSTVTVNPDAGSDAGGTDAGGSDAAADTGSKSDAGDAGVSGTLAFKPSNIDISGIDLSTITDEDVASSCQIRSDGTSDCFNKAAFGTITQADQSKIGVYVVKSLKVEPAAHITVNGLGGNLPIAIVSLGDFTLLGTLDAHGQDIHGSAGGFEGIADQDGSGPGGGPKGGTNLGGGGGSYCGVGGKGNAAMGSGLTPGAPAAAAGTLEIVPLRGGASGGGGQGQGGAGGGGVQLVAGGAFSMAAGSYINVGGGGGAFGASAGGGGAGGSVLIEATTVKIAGVIAANGGGGGGAGPGLDSGGNGTPDANPAAGGPGAVPGAAGSGGTTIDGASAAASTDSSTASGGGGAAGRVRINSKSGQADLTGATLSPAATTPCVTQGTTK